MQILDIDRKIEELQKLKEILLMKPDNFIEDIFLKYIEYGSTARVAKYINDLGYRIEGKYGCRQYISTDITDVLEDPEAKNIVREEIYNLTIEIKRSNKTIKKLFR